MMYLVHVLYTTLSPNQTSANMISIAAALQVVAAVVAHNTPRRFTPRSTIIRTHVKFVVGGWTLPFDYEDDDYYYYPSFLIRRLRKPMCIFGNRCAPLLMAMKTDTHCVFIAFALGRGLAKRPEDPFRKNWVIDTWRFDLHWRPNRWRQSSWRGQVFSVISSYNL